MPKEDEIVLTGTVLEVMKNCKFKVELESNKKVILAHPSGKVRSHNVRVFKGDKVTVVMSPYDLTKGRITWKHNK
jgi:translation initiation factor IF-1